MLLNDGYSILYFLFIVLQPALYLLLMIQTFS